ncbi:MAG TPA: YqiA/YcfP family alpha/beta fold hydrolase [Thermoanaerobaculia bacterium]
MTKVLYFHGFASSPRGRKIELLRQLLPDFDIHAPNLNIPSFAKLEFDAFVAHATEEARGLKPDVIVGSSLGALVALEVANRGIDAPLVLIAPAFGVMHRWKEKIPAGDPVVLFNYATEREETIHRHFFDQMDRNRSDAIPPPVRVVAVMGRNDESVPFDCVFDVWQRWERSGKLVAGSKLIEIAEGDHSLVDHVGLIADEIRRAAG